MASKKGNDKSKVEMPDTSELTNIQVVNNLSEYARMYLDTAFQDTEDEDDVALMVVDGSKPINNKTYLEIGRMASAAQCDKKPYVFISSLGNHTQESRAVTMEHIALITYARSKNLKVTYDPKELLEWLK